ncbi:mannose-1-phosphate guanylyltransferase [Leptotrichia sp. oral taxon 417]|uniref:mannose-1-phosphate guanylyltransferase n=1 Tax=Leptotrichia sp. oral taxon 417 TaxID=712365 RepID=UPI001C5A0D0B|nr:mannose-1-phosphate guanylyltransferase [Leptotrichia sp. oral taxon 417]
MTSVVIMAGGKGERFWPKSRINLPKQFLSLTDDGKSMIQHTVERVKNLVDIENIYVVTNEMYKNLVSEHIPDIPEANIIIEPAAKNTAPCIGLAAVHIAKKDINSKMIILPSDHLIKFNEIFIDTLKTALDVVEKGDNLATIGITPNYPETGYGYINFTKGESFKDSTNIYEVLRFVEKPNLEKAKEYLTSGQYLWNSGMFVWKASTILKNFKEYLPEIYEGLQKIGKSINTGKYEEVLKKEFLNLPSESIDYGIMEKAKNIYVIPGNFGWDDVGSWLSLERINKTNQDGNVITGNVISIKTKNTIIQGSDKLIATIGLEDIVVVDTDDVTLICHKNNTQEVKEVINNLKICNRNEYL